MSPVALLLALIACGGASDSGTSNGGATPNPRTTIDTTALACTPLARPGDSLPPGVGAVAPGPNGTLAWESPARGVVIIRASDGGEIRIGGNRGDSGFRAARAMGWRGDTLWITDAITSRVQRFGPDGKWRGTWIARDILNWIPAGDDRLISAAPFGVIAGKPDTTRVIVVTRHGSPRSDTLVRFSSPPLRGLSVGKNAMIVDPFIELTPVAGAPDGSLWCAVVRSDAVHFRCVDVAGKQSIDVPLTVERRAASAEVYHEILGSMYGSSRAMLAKIESLVPKPDSLPLVFDVRLANDMSPWLLRTHPSEAMQKWLRLTPAGAKRDEWILPRRYALRAVNGDTIWAAESDEAGFQSLTRCVVKIP